MCEVLSLFENIIHFLLQLLDLMHTLHTRAATIFSSWAEEERELCASAEPRPVYLEGVAERIDAGTSSLWTKCWCPLLQGDIILRCKSSDLPKI